MVLGSQGSSGLSLEGFRRSPGVIWSAPGALWGMFGTPLWFKSWPKTLQVLRNAVSFGRSRSLVRALLVRRLPFCAKQLPFDKVLSKLLCDLGFPYGVPRLSENSLGSPLTRQQLASKI